MSKQHSNGGWIVAIVVVLIIVGGIYLARNHRQPHPDKAFAPSVANASTATFAPESIAHPIEQANIAPAAASTVPLPALSSSDGSVISALASLTGNTDLSALLIQPQVVQRIVATIDALPRPGLNMVMLPMNTPKGSFATQDASGATVMSAQNDARYAPYMQVVQSTDPDKLVAWYVHAYPLFQQAYRQLGYPKGYFNDRVIVAIDNLLAAPDLAQRPTVLLSNGYYRYTDPQLESLSAGQRAMLRTGPDNEALLKARLREIKARLLGQHFQQHLAPAPDPAASAG